MRLILAKLTIVAAACVAVFLLLGTLLIHPAKVQAAVEAPHPGVVAMQLGRHTASHGIYCGPPSLAPQVSMLLAKNKIWIGLTTFWLGDTNYDRNAEQYQWTVPNIEGEYDWQAAGQTLAEIRLSIKEYTKTENADGEHWFNVGSDIEIAAEDEVQYGELVAAMDLAVANAFVDFSVLSPDRLSARLQE